MIQRLIDELREFQKVFVPFMGIVAWIVGTIAAITGDDWRHFILLFCIWALALAVADAHRQRSNSN